MELKGRMMKLNGPLMELHERLMERNQSQKKLRQRSIVLHECRMELREWAMKRRKCSAAPPEFAMVRRKRGAECGKDRAGSPKEWIRNGQTAKDRRIDHSSPTIYASGSIIFRYVFVNLHRLAP